MLSKIKIIPEILTSVIPAKDVFHYEALGAKDKYAVWAEDSEGSSLEADNRKAEYSVQGTIDYYTSEDMDPNVDKIQEALTVSCISFYLNSVQYESADDSGSNLTHYEWVWEVS